MRSCRRHPRSPAVVGFSGFQKAPTPELGDDKAHESFSEFGFCICRSLHEGSLSRQTGKGFPFFEGTVRQADGRLERVHKIKATEALTRPFWSINLLKPVTIPSQGFLSQFAVLQAYLSCSLMIHTKSKEMGVETPHVSPQMLLTASVSVQEMHTFGFQCRWASRREGARFLCTCVRTSRGWAEHTSPMSMSLPESLSDPFGQWLNFSDVQYGGSDEL